MKYLKLLLCVSLLALPLFGCAFGTDYVKINKYTPEVTSSSGSSGEGKVVYLTKVEDNRSQPEYLGQKAGGYIALEKGLNLADIETTSIANCLESAGYTVKYSDNPPEKCAVLHASVEELWTTFVQGFWTVDADAKAKMEFELTDSSGTRTLWRKKIGKGAVNSAVAAPPGLFEDALNESLAEVMKEFQSEVSSDGFAKAVSAASEAGTQAQPAAQTEPATE
jgi:hypothetical protein